jgi:hypothetical protein
LSHTQSSPSGLPKLGASGWHFTLVGTRERPFVVSPQAWKTATRSVWCVESAGPPPPCCAVARSRPSSSSGAIRSTRCRKPTRRADSSNRLPEPRDMMRWSTPDGFSRSCIRASLERRADALLTGSHPSGRSSCRLRQGVVGDGAPRAGYAPYSVLTNARAVCSVKRARRRWRGSGSSAGCARQPRRRSAH